LPRKFLNDEVELGKLLAGKALAEDGRQLAVLFGEQREIALRAADVTRKDHLYPPNPAFKSVEADPY
jgi:hypothetical protein